MFLANLHSSSSEKYSYMFSMTPKISFFFFAYGHQNYENYIFLYVIYQTFLQISSIKEDILQFCALFLPIPFLLAKFLHFSQQFQNQRKILHYFYTQIKNF
jgi:hypothetical protein